VEANPWGLRTMHANFQWREIIQTMVEIQILDYSKNWRTVSNVVDNVQRVEFELKSVKSRYADRRVRAIGSDGRLIDLLE
jgi:hypothetical protein